MNMKANIITAIRLSLVLLVLCSGIYPLFILGIAKITPMKGEGEKTVVNEKTQYVNIGQKFDSEQYFWSRPSAVDYNAAGSAGSNKGPSNPDYLADVQKRIDVFLELHPDQRKSAVPVDLVTASGSGLDPHISVQAARVQAGRIAQIRGISKPSIEALIDNQTEQPLFGIFGPSRINVCKLNLALDQLK
jgi:K+-transporting ATPase ATPase C chain